MTRHLLGRLWLQALYPRVVKRDPRGRFAK